MSTYKIWHIVFAILVIASLALSGCTTPATPSAEPTKVPATQPPATQAPTAEKPAAVSPTAEPPTAEPSAQPTSGGGQAKIVTMTFTTGDPDSLNPIYATQWIAECMFDLSLASMWNIENDGSYVMDLAMELPNRENGGVSEDGLTITYKLRKDVTWSDGQPLTAQDAVFTYDMTMSDKNNPGSRYPWDTYVESVTALDENTLQVKLNQPYADWSTSLYVGISRIIPRHILQPIFEAQGTLDNADWNRLPTVTSGPFIITEFEPASHLILKANDKYWRGRPTLDQINIRLVEDRAAQLAALASGESDIGSYIIGSEVPEITKMGNMEIMTAENGYQVVMFFNVDPKTASPGMTDERVRRAIAYAIDRNLINQELYNGLYKVPATFWSGSPFEDPNLKPYPFDPEGAKKLLDEAGWKDTNGDGIREKDGKDLALRYVYIGGDKTGDTMVVTIQQMLKDVGIKVDITTNTKEVLWASYTDNGPLALGQYDMTHWSDGMWYFPSPDTSYFLCNQIPTEQNPYGYDWFGICIPELDELFAKQAVELDQQKRIEMLFQIEKIMYDKALILPLHTDPDVWAVNQRVLNAKFSGIDPLMYAWSWDVSQ